MTRKGLVVLALIIIGFILINGPYLVNESTWPDEALYARYVELFRDGKVSIWIPDTWVHDPPLPYLAPLFYVIAAQVPLEPLLAIRLASFVFGILSIIMLYMLGSKSISENVGLMAAFLLAFNVVFSTTATRGLIDTALVFVFILAALTITSRNFRTKRLCLAATAGFAILLKEAGFILFGIIGVYELFNEAAKGKPARFVSAIILLTAFCLVGVVFIAGGDQQLVHSIKTVETFAYLVAGLFFYFVLLLPFIVGIFLLYKHKKSLAKYVLIWIASVFGIFALIGPITRYVLPAAPAVALTTAIGVSWFASETRKRYGKNSVLLLVFFAVVAVVVMGGINWEVNTVKSVGYLGFQEAGDWISEHAGPEAQIFATGFREVGFYSGRTFENQGDGVLSLPENMCITCKGTCYVVIDELETMERYGQDAKQIIGRLEECGFENIYEIKRDTGESGAIVINILQNKDFNGCCT